MNLSDLSAISPVDGRYHSKTQELAPFFSEFGLIRYRVLVEIEYFIALCDIPLPQLVNFNQDLRPALQEIYTEFTNADARKIKDIERVTNHDVKAVEYFIKEKFDELGLSEYKEFIHFGLTSQDINNTAVPLSAHEGYHEVYEPLLEELMNKLEALALEWQDVPMLAFTHGQPASPTRLGKELAVFLYRLDGQLDSFDDIPITAKFGGATGNFNAHYAAYPDIDWLEFADNFINDTLDLNRSQFTTQIDNYDFLAALFDNFARINTILLDLSRDVWTYVSMGYFRQKVKKGEVGSSAMPHKVNPINFENAEGNLGIANALFHHLSAKLPISRLQRDLTDSTVLRNIGVPLAHTLIAFKSLLKGLNKLEINESRIERDLHENWAVVAEAIQTILRREGYPKPYEALKNLTRGNENIDQKAIHNFIDTLEVDDKVKAELRQFTPFTYTGVKF